MNGSMRRSARGGCASWGAAILILACMSNAWAQGRPSSESIVGGWTLGSVVLEQGGTRQEPFGRNPVGFASFHPDGTFSYMILRSDLPRIASGNRFTATPEEMKAIYLGTIAYFGKYAIEEASGTLLLHIEVSNFTNWSGTTEKRLLSLKEGEMRLVNPNPPTGGTSYIVWRRAAR